MRMPLMLISLESASKFGDRLKGIGLKLLGIYPAITYDLESASLRIEAHKYMLAAFFSALIWALMFGIFSRVVGAARGFPEPVLTVLPFALFIVSFAGFFALHVFYPGIISSRLSERVNRELVFALRDLMIQVSSGIPLYSAMRNIAKSDYREVSREFAKVVKDIEYGSSTVDALEGMVLRTKSFYLKKTTWQLITSVRAGGNITEALKSMVKMLVDYQRQLVKGFNAELNFYVLVFLLFAAVLPSVGVTVMIIFSVFGILGISEGLFIALALVSFLAQAVIIGFVYTSRPSVYL